MRCSKDGFVRICSYRRINGELTIQPSFGTGLSVGVGYRYLNRPMLGPVNPPHCYVLVPLGWMGLDFRLCDGVKHCGRGGEMEVLTKYTTTPRQSTIEFRVQVCLRAVR